MLSAYGSVGYYNQGSNDPFPFIVVVIMAIFLLGCYCGWKLHACVTRMGQRRVGEIIGDILH